MTSGTGYSSFTHLRELPVDVVKIDRSFVGRMCEESADAAIVYATIELAHRLNLRVVAEGVETSEPGRRCCELGSDKGPGLRVQPAAAACANRGATGTLAERSLCGEPVLADAGLNGQRRVHLVSALHLPDRERLDLVGFVRGPSNNNSSWI